jgi:LysM repeat protein
MPETPIAPVEPQQGKSIVAMHPVIAFALLLLAILLVFVVWRSRQQASQPPVNTDTNAPPGTSGASGLSTDANGNPVVYVPASNFLNYNYTLDSYNTSHVSNTTNNEPGALPTVAPPTHIPAVQPPPKQTAGSWTCRYTVVAGDTLSGIAARHKTNWPAVYAHNAATIDAIASVMHYVIPGGAWNNIRPGEVLIVPCV